MTPTTPAHPTRSRAARNLRLAGYGLRRPKPGEVETGEEPLDRRHLVAHGDKQRPRLFGVDDDPAVDSVRGWGLTPGDPV